MSCEIAEEYIEACIIFGDQLSNLGLELYSDEIYMVDEEGNEIKVNKPDYSKE